MISFIKKADNSSLKFILSKLFKKFKKPENFLQDRHSCLILIALIGRSEFYLIWLLKSFYRSPLHLLREKRFLYFIIQLARVPTSHKGIVLINPMLRSLSSPQLLEVQRDPFVYSNFSQAIYFTNLSEKEVASKR